MSNPFPGYPSGPSTPPKKSNATLWIVLAIIAGVVLIVISCGILAVVANQPRNTSEKLYRYPSPSVTQTTPAPVKTIKTFNINDVVEIVTRDGKATMKLSDVKMVSDTFDRNKKYIALLVEIEVISGKASYNPLNFNLRNADGTEYGTISGLFADAEPKLQSSNDLQAGQKARGYIAFGAPEAVIKTGTLEYGSFGGPDGYWKLG